MIEPQIVALIEPLVGNRVFPDTAPIGTSYPYVLYQQVGGKPINVLETRAMDKKNARIQVMVWAETRPQCTTLARQIEDSLVNNLQAYVEGALVADHDIDSGLYGSRQDFSFWF